MAIRSDLYSCLLDDLCDVIGYSSWYQLQLGHKPNDISLPPDVAGNPRSFAGMALLRSVFKKFQDEIDQKKADNAAYAKFNEMNELCGNWNLQESELGPYDETLIGEFRRSMYNFFTVEGYDLLDVAEVYRHVSFGPGASPGAEALDFAAKLGHSVLTATSPFVVHLFDEWMRACPARVDCEIARVLAFGAPKIVRSVKISSVPKTTEISRLVKPEPLLNIFIQQGIRGVMEDRLARHFKIRLDEQPIHNAELARIGSVDRSFGTIDLTSASDLIAMEMCREFIPKGSFRFLRQTRSEMADVPGPNGVGTNTISLNMIATMGNAFCFPLETAIFACVVEAAYRTLGIPFEMNRVVTKYDPETRVLRQERIPGNWGVFGDDIIVRRDAYDSVIRLLKWLGFIPNLDKSFNDGNFRESCGSDWLFGEQVRGVYCSSLKTPQDRVSLFNRLNDWSCRTGIPLKGTLQYLRRICAKAPLVPPWESDTSGLKVPWCLVDPRTDSRVKVLCHIGELRHPPYTQIEFDHKLAEDGLLEPVLRITKLANGKVLRNTPGSILYTKWEPYVRRTRVDDEADTGGYFNSSAIYLSALAGMVRGGQISHRDTGDKPTSYSTTRAVAPCWDFIAVVGDSGIARLEAWIASTLNNLF